MGLLAEGKNRRKLNSDPNNTKWTRDTNRFGQKILRSQGWQPGEFLGAQDAPHSEFHTSANASYIRVALKDDMKGLGFDKRKEDEAAGLYEFSDLLSRLNGKSDQAVEKEKQARLEVKMHAYVQSRYGPMRFVKGGLLVGDEMKDESSSEISASKGGTGAEDATQTDDNKKPKKSKKRKAGSLEDDGSGGEMPREDVEKKRRKQRKGERMAKKRSGESPADDSAASDQPKVKEKKRKSRKGDRLQTETEADTQTAQSNAEDDSSAGDTPTKSKSKSKGSADEPAHESGNDEAVKAKKSKKERKEEKREKKERKKEKKEEKKRRKEAKAAASQALGAPSSTDATPATSGTSTPRPTTRHVRSRFLAAKREAMMNESALNKIWMVKA